MLSLLGALFMGWSLGANDAANVIGPAVSSRMLRFRAAVLLAAAFVMLGAMLEGRAGIATYAGLTRMTLADAVIASVAAALTMTILSLLGLPASSSQATVGAILAIGVLQNQVNAAGFGKVLACWIGTPLGGALIAVLLYPLLGAIYNRLRLNLFQADALLRLGLIAAGAYGAYVLGANNVANVTGIFVGAGYLDVHSASVIGGGSIALGVLTCSRKVIDTLGKGLAPLNAFSALVALLASSAAVHLYTVLGVPVSTTQAIVGAVLGVGLVRSIHTVRPRAVIHVFLGWVCTPLLGFALALLAHFVTHLRYLP